VVVKTRSVHLYGSMNLRLVLCRTEARAETRMLYSRGHHFTFPQLKTVLYRNVFMNRCLFQFIVAHCPVNSSMYVDVSWCCCVSVELCVCVCFRMARMC